MDWVNVAEEYCGRFGWGARGKYIGISRMMNDNDKILLSQGMMMATVRPRGILSGFLAIVPSQEYAVFLPPIAAKIGPQRIRMRLSDSIKDKGAIFSAYMTREKTMILEDILVWQEKSVWFTDTFRTRWNQLLSTFVVEKWREDTELQGCQISLATYSSLGTLTQPESSSVIEFVPNAANQKRLIWLGSASKPTASLPQTQTQTQTQTPAAPIAENVFTVKKEAGMGPDVYAIFKNGERLGLAMVRTLAVSRALRSAIEKSETVRVAAVLNKQFEKWEVTSVL